MLGASTIMCKFWVARYSWVHVLQPGTRKASLLDKSFLMPTGVCKKAIHLLPCTILCTFQPNVPSIYMPCTFQQPSLMPRLFFWNETTMHLPFTDIRMPCTPYRVTYLRCCKAANSMWRINTTPLPGQHTRMLLICHFSSGVA